jgi:hypothetical protein
MKCPLCDCWINSVSTNIGEHMIRHHSDTFLDSDGSVMCPCKWAYQPLWPNLASDVVLTEHLTAFDDIENHVLGALLIQ